MANTYCENKSNKPVITRYDPSKNYVVQMVESLASIDYPNENHIYVIESTGEKYIYYNGAFSKFTSTPLEPLIVGLTATYTSSDRIAYQYYYSDNVVFDTTYDEVVEAVNQGRPVYLQPANASLLYDFDITVSQYNVTFSSGGATRNSDNTQHTIYNQIFVLPSNSTTGTSTRVVINAHNLVPDTALSSTSTRPVQNRVIKQAIDAISALSNPLMITATVGTKTTDNGHAYMYQYSNDVTYSKLYSEVKNAVDNGVPIVITVDGVNHECTAYEESNRITLDVFNQFIDSATNPRYRVESFVINSDNTGSWIKTVIVIDAFDSFYDYIMGLQNGANSVPRITVTGTDQYSSNSISSTNLKKTDSYVCWRWGDKSGISPLIRVAYTEDGEDFDRVFMQIDSDTYREIIWSDPNGYPREIEYKYVQFKIVVATQFSVNTQQSARKSLKSNQVKLVIHTENGNDCDVTSFEKLGNGVIKDANATNTNGYIIIGHDGNYFTIANMTSANKTFSVGTEIAVLSLI